MDMMDKILYKYVNGNTTVTIYENGTKVREFDNVPVIEHPESMDIKITNYCDLNCPYCHEESTIRGTHANLEALKMQLDVLPAGVELALGGGNPLSHPNLIEFLYWCKEKNFIANITINEKHINSYNELILKLITEDLVKGIGISITEGNMNVIKSMYKLSPNIVLHLIIGVNEYTILDKIKEIKNSKVLLLGYKSFGRGIKYNSDTVQANIKEWYDNLSSYLGKLVISFDNLAIEQLELKRLLSDKTWSTFYMGDDFTFTMYIDAVNQMFSPTSRSNNRKSFNEFTLLEYFQTFKNK